VSKAETEQSDYRRVDSEGKPARINVFFGPEKFYLGLHMSVFVYNAAVLIISSIALLAALYWILRRQLRTKGV
jgi:hypothetical protein